MEKSSLARLRQISILSVILTVFSCTSSQEQKEARVVPVKVQKIVYDHNRCSQEYIGTVESEKSVDVSFLVSGTVERLCVNEGERVDKGQLLGSLNTTTLENAHELASARLRQAEDAFKRMAAMYKNKSLPEIQYIDAKTKLEQAQAAEVIARKNLQDCNIYAPQSGVIGKRYLETGANVMAGMPIFNVMDISSVKIKTAIPESEISDINTGDISKVRISALNNEVFEGVIIEKGVVANPISHTYDIKVKVNNPTGKIMPGMVCRVYVLNDGNHNGSIIIPLKSVQVDFSGKRFVWLKDNQNKAVCREVTLSDLAGNGVQVASGLKEGDELIVAGYQNVSAGAAVSVN